VGALAVLAEALAVIRQDEDERPVELARRPEVVEQASDHRVRVRDFRVVRFVLGGVRLGRAIGLMRVVKMDPRKEGC
jgi:hypothetical protein